MAAGDTGIRTHVRGRHGGHFELPDARDPSPCLSRVLHRCRGGGPGGRPPDEDTSDPTGVRQGHQLCRRGGHRCLSDGRHHPLAVFAERSLRHSGVHLLRPLHYVAARRRPRSRRHPRGAGGEASAEQCCEYGLRGVHTRHLDGRVRGGELDHGDARLRPAGLPVRPTEIHHHGRRTDRGPGTGAREGRGVGLPLQPHQVDRGSPRPLQISSEGGSCFCPPVYSYIWHAYSIIADQQPITDRYGS
mmetsp:Transcript_6626/g.13832  ORF Transcript_6626/g.13832 Transcript_6626/m.13832 type:complete len:245 (+) Transcript_6626:1352-2086(+)